jgi:membrane protein YdbS with pleckstrin-like domain
VNKRFAPTRGLGQAGRMADETEWFPTKVDTWLAILLIVAPLVSAIGLVIPGTFASLETILVSLAGPLVFGLIYTLLVFPMRYGIDREHGQLVIRHGVVRQRVKLSEILRVEPTRSPLSSPALSLDRLLVSKGDGFTDSIMISPAERERFITLLAEQANLVREGDRLLRK